MKKKPKPKLDFYEQYDSIREDYYSRIASGELIPLDVQYIGEKRFDEICKLNTAKELKELGSWDETFGKEYEEKFLNPRLPAPPISQTEREDFYKRADPPLKKIIEAACSKRYCAVVGCWEEAKKEKKYCDRHKSGATARKQNQRKRDKENGRAAPVENESLFYGPCIQCGKVDTSEKDRICLVCKSK
jgi:hypothetical protein